MKMLTTRLGKLLGGAALVAGIFAAPAAQANFVISFNTNGTFSGTPVDPSMQFATATFVNNGANQVRLTLDFANVLTGSPIISEWSFNVLSGLSISTIAFNSALSSEVPAISPVGSFSTNHFKADGTGGYFDLLLDFHPNGALSQQHEATSMVWDFTGAGLTENSFNALSTGGRPSLLGAVHIQNYGVGSDSIWVGGGPGCVPVNPGDCEPPEPPTGEPMPEPASLALVGLGLGMMAMRRRKH